MRWEAALSLEYDDRCDRQMKYSEEHAVVAHATRSRQAQNDCPTSEVFVRLT